MGDGLKISKGKRHRSSSSIATNGVEVTRSERKLDIREYIPETDDHFAMADARCKDLQEKIDLVKVLKRKKKLKGRSMTRVMGDNINEIEKVPFMTVHTQPKKKITQQSARMRRFEMEMNPVRGYVDPATVEQRRMLGHVQGYNDIYSKSPHGEQQKPANQYKSRILQPDGDVKFHERGKQLSHQTGSCYIENALNEPRCQVVESEKIGSEPRIQHTGVRNATRRYKSDELHENQQEPTRVRFGTPTHRNLRLNPGGNYRSSKGDKAAEKPEIELLFNNNKEIDGKPSQSIHSDIQAQRESRNQETRMFKIVNARKPEPREVEQEISTANVSISKDIKERHRRARKIRYRSRRYELPTISSRMKNSGTRYYYGSNSSNIPFVASKSTTPSHNIGVNIQQVLNGLKMQQPIAGIPLTIAHHMGLRHIPNCNSSKESSVEPSLDIHEVNVIRVGNKLLRLPSYKYMSYNRLLSLYREGDGMVPRFLRAISRPNYFYTSMYNLATHRDDMDAATSKGYQSQVAKQTLAEYANLYREYEKLDKSMKEGNYTPECEKRKNEVSRELAAREEYIRRVVHEYRTPTEVDHSQLRASASTAEDGYRHSTFKLN